MNKLVIDLEMCQGVQIGEVRSQEIIEVGAVLLNESNNILETYQRYVKNEYGELTPKIMSLTGITLADTEQAPKLADVISELGERIKDPTYKDTKLYTWSSNDSDELLKELEIKNIAIEGLKEFIENYIDIQKIFGEKTNIYKQMNLAKALTLLGIDFEGKEHGALADAINTAKVLQLLENNKEIQKLVEKIHKTLEAENLHVSLGSLFDFSKLNLGD